MDLLTVFCALAFLMFAAYRGQSVILFAPLAAMGAVLVMEPALVAPMFTGLFMEKLAAFLRNFLPVFLLGALFGKVVEMAGFSSSIAGSVVRLFGRERAVFAIVSVCALLTYGGVSLFVVVFAVYPFAAELFRKAELPKRLIPATVALGAFSFTMDALPGTPQIQNIIPTTVFKTTVYAAPRLGCVGAVMILGAGLWYLGRRCRRAAAAGEGYGEGHVNEPETTEVRRLAHPIVALLPLLVVGLVNRYLSGAIPEWVGSEVSFLPAVVGKVEPVVLQTKGIVATWAVAGGLLAGIACVFALNARVVAGRFADGCKTAVAGALLAAMNTASEYGFGAVIAALPGFLVVARALAVVSDPLVNEALTITSLAGITGSASGGLGLALAALGESFVAHAGAAGIPAEVLHRVASMASGGMDTLPHNGAVITLLSVTGLTHRQAYADIFAITCIKTVAVFVVIGVFYATQIV